jgi:GMP synthase-like glutamine amidotransferase
VIGLGVDFYVFVSSEKCPVHAFQWGRRPVWGIQSHPEMSIPDALRYLRGNVTAKHESFSLYQKALDSTPRDTGMIHAVVKNFIGYSETVSSPEDF